MRSLYYAPDGTPLDDALEWARLFEDNANRRIADTRIRQFRVSTIWIGLDTYSDGPPMIYETMIFDRKGKDHGQWRYPTRKLALKGHSHFCRMIHSGWRGEKNDW